MLIPARGSIFGHHQLREPQDARLYVPKTDKEATCNEHIVVDCWDRLHDGSDEEDDQADGNTHATPKVVRDIRSCGGQSLFFRSGGKAIVQNRRAEKPPMFMMAVKRPSLAPSGWPKSAVVSIFPCFWDDDGSCTFAPWLHGLQTVQEGTIVTVDCSTCCC